jgi:hypothetical protein
MTNGELDDFNVKKLKYIPRLMVSAVAAESANNTDKNRTAEVFVSCDIFIIQIPASLKEGALPERSAPHDAKTK